MRRPMTPRNRKTNFNRRVKALSGRIRIARGGTHKQMAGLLGITETRYTAYETRRRARCGAT